MLKDGRILFGKTADEDGALREVCLDLSMANRHGLIAGATGSGKTVSLKVLAESFSDAGVPVFLADIKGDLGSIAQMGADEEHVTGRVESMGLAQDGFAYRSYPVAFWDVYGEKGMPLRTTVSEMGPLLLARVLGLNDLQTDILSVVFRIADDSGLLLIDTKDLKAMLNYVGEHAREYAASYGRIAQASLDAIMRSVVSLETQGAELFFGEPALSITDLLNLDQGRGLISVLDCRKLILHPDMYSAMLLWMLSELYETLPEVGDQAKPKLVFFFDEAHMLFENASRDLLQRIEQTVRLIRSKGVGIFFVTQNPADIPEGIMGQLGSKIEHALHAYSPKEMKAVKAAAESFRPNPAFDTAEAIQGLGTGEAVVSFPDMRGVPSVAEKVQVLPPQSFNGASDDSLRESMIKGNLLYSKYAGAVDRDSAYEFLMRRQIAPDALAGQQTYSAPQASGVQMTAMEQAPDALEGQQTYEGQNSGAGQQASAEQNPGAPQLAQSPNMAPQQTYSAPQASGGQMTAMEQALAEAKQAKADALAAQREAQKQILAAQKAAEKQAAQAQKAAEKQAAQAQKEAEKQAKAAQKALEREEKRKKQEMSKVAKTITGTVGRELGKNIGKSLGGSFGRTVGGNVGAQLGRSILGTLFKI